MKLKHSVKFGNSESAIAIALIVANDVFFQLGYECVVTSFNDSVHSTNSLHYKDCAFDLRTKHIETIERKKEIIAKIKENLTDDFDVVFESEGKEQEHLHIEYDKK